MQIAFWSTVHGQTATTSSALAIGTITAINNNYKTLIAHSHLTNSTLEKCFLTDRELNVDGIFDFSDSGIDALSRLAKNKRLTPDIVSNYTVSLLQNSRLDLLTGTVREEKEIYKEENTLTDIFECAKQYYDLIFIDVHSGLDSEVSKLILNSSDLIVICLNQNRHIIENYINKEKENPIINNKKTIINLGMYDSNLKYSKNNIKKKYKLSPIINIPYNSQFKEECNNSTVLDFLLRNIDVKKSSPNYKFMNELEKGSNILLETLKDGENN